MKEPNQRPVIDPLYQKGAEAIYNSNKEASGEAFKIAAEYGRWLVSSVLLLHAGAIAGLFTFMGTIVTSERFNAVAYAAAVWWFVYGIVAILFCGFMLWVNWSSVAKSFDHFARPWMLVDPSRFPADNAPGGWKITVTYWLAIVSGWISVGCLLRGAYVVSKALGS